LESVVSEDVDLTFTRSGVSVRTAHGISSKATPGLVHGRSKKSRAVPIAAAAVGLAVISAVVFWKMRSPPPAPAPAEPVAVVAPAPAPAPVVTAPTVPAVAAEPAAADAPSKKIGGRTGRVQIEATPALTVSTKGHVLGRTPGPFDLPAGKHVLRLFDTGAGIEKILTVSVKPGELTRSTVALGKGKLDLRVSPWAQVKLDGKSIGNTPIPVQDLYEGAHQLELSNPELGKTKKLEVRVSTGETRVVRESFE
jgi:hypothetical protein